ncbi:MAG TPA: division/cell wall cluster transcriptional repressor MraZ [Candidatus Paceibacterota bacterium]
MLIGEYRHVIDDKNRLSLPAKFRRETGKRVVITSGLDSCLFVFTTKSWESITERLSSADSSMLQADNRGFNRYLLGGAVEIEVDALGRMLIPDYLISRAKLGRNVVIVGVRERAEIWDEERWNAYRADIEGKANTLAEKMGEKIGEVGLI